MALMLPIQFERITDSNGNPINGAKLKIFDAGTSDLADIFTDVEGVTPAANPIVANSAGILAARFLADGTYDFQWLNASDVQLDFKGDVVVSSGSGGGGGGGGGGGDPGNADLYNVLTKTSNYTVQSTDVDGNIAFILFNPDGIPGLEGIVTIDTDDITIDKAVTVINTGATGDVVVQTGGGAQKIDADTTSVTIGPAEGRSFVSIGAGGLRTAGSTTVGVPPGGATGAFLRKTGSGSYEMAWQVPDTTREVLTANRTYYVRADGNDTNNGLANTAGGAFRTIQKGVDVALGLDFAGFTVTIQVGDSTAWTATTNIYAGVGILDATKFVIQGNSGTPANVRINVTSGNCFNVTENAVVTIKDMELRTTTSGACLQVIDGGYVEFGNLVFGACAGTHVNASSVGKARAISNCTVNGGATAILGASLNATITLGTITLTISGSPSITSAAVASSCGTINVSGATLTGSYTGADATAQTNGVVLGGTGFSGSGSTSTSTGGQIT